MDLSAAKCLQGIYSTLLYVISCRKTFSWCGQFLSLGTFEGAHNLRNALMQICCKTHGYIKSKDSVAGGVWKD